MIDKKQLLKVMSLKTGWADPGFEENINQIIDEQQELGWDYVDLKISSSDLNCLLIFRYNLFGTYGNKKSN